VWTKRRTSVKVTSSGQQTTLTFQKKSSATEADSELHRRRHFQVLSLLLSLINRQNFKWFKLQNSNCVYFFNRRVLLASLMSEPIMTCFKNKPKNLSCSQCNAQLFMFSKIYSFIYFYLMRCLFGLFFCLFVVFTDCPCLALIFVLNLGGKTEL
jgi:hypothetical protein